MKRTVTPTIQTSRNRMLDFVQPQPEQMHIEDFFASLPRLPRWTGQTRMDQRAYSVAEHSVACANLIPDDNPIGQFVALTHDFHEVYINDLSTPLKSLIPGYKEVEERVKGAVALFLGYGLIDKADLEAALSRTEWADRVALSTEYRSLFELHIWEPGGDRRSYPCVGQGEFAARKLLMERMNDICDRLPNENLKIHLRDVLGEHARF